MRFVDERDYDVLLTETTRVERPDGSPLAVLLKQALSPLLVQNAWSVLHGYYENSDNRGTAAGIESEGRMRKDGTRSQTQRVPKGWGVYSGIIGYFERTVRMPYCRACAWNLQHPEKFNALMPMVKQVDRLFAEHVPDRYEYQKDYARRTAPDFLIPDTAFTTMTVNKNFRTACHKDAGDLAQGFSCISAIRQGAYKGGDLVLPNWRIAVKLDTYDLLLFDPHEWHGNTQIVPLTPDAQRCTIVYYYREAMIRCKSAQEELEQAKRRKTGDPLWEKCGNNLPDTQS
jgi:hypothetical protein